MLSVVQSYTVYERRLISEKRIDLHNSDGAMDAQPWNNQIG